MKSISITLLVALSALAGNDSGKGGDPWAAEFVAKGYYILGHLRSQQGNSLLTGAELEDFEKALKTTRVELVTKLEPDPEAGEVTSQVVDDPKYPGRKMIRIEKGSLQKALADAVGVDRYVFHEYLRVIGKEDSHYEVSSQIGLIKGVLPFRIEYRSFVSGARVPLKKPIQGTRFQFGCKYPALFESVDREADSLARESYADEFLHWSGDLLKDVKRDLNPKFMLLDVRTRNNEYRNDLAEDDLLVRKGMYLANNSRANLFTYFWQRMWEAVIEFGLPADESCFSLVDYRSMTDQGVSIDLETRIPIQVLSRQQIRGEEKEFGTFPAWTADQIVAALDGAEQGYIRACQTWKEKWKEKLGDRYVFARCGRNKQIRKELPRFHDGRLVHFESEEGSIYFATRDVP
ncbi:MAG: hypothetical protein HYR96_05930 [Deltaproteobacteria bacterium]|nr:hypothetical protein [Deltaproteobacteria bacterium]